MHTTYFIVGDLLKSARTHNLINALGHGANCWSTMGSGIAGKIASDFRELMLTDKIDERSPEERMGNLSHAFDKGFLGFNLYTQFYPGPNAKFEAVKSSVQLMLENVHELVDADHDDKVVIGLPAIGCGIGGLQFRLVAQLVHSLVVQANEDGYNAVVVFYVMPGQFEAEIKSLIDSPDFHLAESEDEIKSMENIENV